MVAVTMVTIIKTNLMLKRRFLFLNFYTFVTTLAYQEYDWEGRDVCKENEFYDIFSFKCIPCGQWIDDAQINFQTRDPDHQTDICICKKEYKQLYRLDYMQIVCSECPDSEHVSIDQFNCHAALCSKNNNCSIAYDKEKEILVDRLLNGTFIERRKESCELETKPNKNNNKCVPCLRDPLNSTHLFCQPSPGYKQIDGEWFNSTHLIPESAKNVHTVNFDHGKAIESSLLSKSLRKAAYKCRHYFSAQACNYLANLCVLQLYEYTDNGPCKIYEMTQKALREDKQKENRLSMPSFWEPDYSILSKTDFPTVFSFRAYDENSFLPLKIARYDVDGQLLGIQNATPSILQICPLLSSNSFWFGSWYSRECTLKASFLWDYKTEFYELCILYIEYVSDDKRKLISIPIKNVNVRMKDNKNRGVLTRRFFIVDNLIGVSADSKSGKAEVIRYANSISLSVQLQEDEDVGKIYLPLLTVSYSEVALDDIDKDLKAYFEIKYWMKQKETEEDITIAIATFSVLAIILSILTTWSWSKRIGRFAIDIYALVKMLLYMSGYISNAFLLVFYLVSLIRLIFYKEQKEPSLVNPTKDQEQVFYQYIIAAFCLKCVDLLHKFHMYTNVDMFFVDWERPRLSEREVTQTPISIWRSYYIAKEWKKLLTYRKTSSAINLILLLIFLKVLNFETIALLKPESAPINQCEPFSQTFRFAVGVSFFFLAAFIQVVCRILHDTFFGDKITRFTDLCSICNVSVFIFTYNQFGYYIHGRSVHGQADTDMKQFNEHLKREEDNLCSQRGLVPNTSLQSFIIFVTREFRQQFNKIHMPAVIEGSVTNTRSRLLPNVAHSFTKLGALSEQFILSYQTMNKFLSAFIDHALQDLDYIVKNKLTTEKLFNIEFQEPTDTSFFYNDPSHTFTHILFYGHELDFLVWEILLVSLIDILTGDFLISVVITIISYKILEMMYQNRAKWNMASKSLLDRRFLI